MPDPRLVRSRHQFPAQVAQLAAQLLRSRPAIAGSALFPEAHALASGSSGVVELAEEPRSLRATPQPASGGTRERLCTAPSAPAHADDPPPGLCWGNEGDRRSASLAAQPAHAAGEDAEAHFLESEQPDAFQPGSRTPPPLACVSRPQGTGEED